MTKEKKPTITVSPRSDESTWSADDIIRKRLEGDPFGRKSGNDVPMRDREAWHQHWFNSLNDPGRLHDVRHNKGWVPVTVDDLPEGITPESIGLQVGTDGSIRRGDRATEEVLFKMPEHLNQQIQMRKAEKNTKGLRSEAAAKNEAAEAVAGSHGSQAADYISKHANITIKDHQGPMPA